MRPEKVEVTAPDEDHNRFVRVPPPMEPEPGPTPEGA